MLDPARTLALAERVAETARRLGFETALIGAAALAIHRYTRGTEDIDLAVAVDPYSKLAALESELATAGLHTRLRLPDDDDPLGGVLSVSAPGAGESQFDVVEVVNFVNPAHASINPAAGAIARARQLPGSPLRCVTVGDLVALKLYAGSLADHADIVELIARNAEADLAVIRSVAAPYDRDRMLDHLLEEAVKRRGSLAR
jgi:cobalamin biosynthesis Mg chelatase CobN